MDYILNWRSFAVFRRNLKKLCGTDVLNYFCATFLVNKLVMRFVFLYNVLLVTIIFNIQLKKNIVI